MPIIIIVKKAIEGHPDLKEELKLLAESVEERSGTILYRVGSNLRRFIEKLNPYHIEYRLKHS